MTKINKCINNGKENDWVSQVNYEKINNEINEWPNWKKAAYNDIFAISAHAKKLLISEENKN